MARGCAYSNAAACASRPLQTRTTPSWLPFGTSDLRRARKSYLERNDSIANRRAREICFVDADYKMRRTFQKLEEKGLIQKIPGTNQATTAYRKGPKFRNWHENIKRGA